MELAHSLLLNEDALSRISENKRPVFIFEWLRFLDKVLVAAQKSDIKESQKKLIDQLTSQISQNLGPPTRKLLARCLATIFSVGDAFSLYETINICNDIVKSKDDSPSFLPTKLTAIACIGGLYEKLGRMVGRSYEETVTLLIKSQKNAESQGRCETMLTLQKIVYGLGSAGSNSHMDIFKAAHTYMCDTVMTVRCAATKCMLELVKEATFVHTTKLEPVVSLCIRSLGNSNYDVRCEVAKLLGYLMFAALQPRSSADKSTSKKITKLEDVLNLLADGFLKGGKGFLRAGDMMNRSGAVNREVRVGLTHAYVEFISCMGSVWLERNLTQVLAHVLALVTNAKAATSHIEAVYARKCILFILRSVIGGILGEKAQITAAKEICQVVVKQMNALDIAAEQGKDFQVENSLTHHSLVCALHELGCLVMSLATSAAPLISEPSTGIIEPVVSVLIHPTPATRIAAAWCLRCVAIAIPSQMTILMERCVSRMHHLKNSPEAISGYSYALTALLGGVSDTALGIPHSKGKQIFEIAEDLLRTVTQSSRLSLQRTQSGWLLLSALMTLGPAVVKSHLPRMLLLWRNAFPRSAKDIDSEKSRGDTFTWQVTLEGRAGALGSMESFLSRCPDLVTEDVVRRMLVPLEFALTLMSNLPSIIKMFGSNLKASAAMLRLRLYNTLALLPAASYESMLNSLLRELVAEFTLTDNPSFTTASLLRSFCHVDDSVILGSWLQETDHKMIEDQLQPNSAAGSGALEHDAASLYAKTPGSDVIPGTLPLGVAVIDSSVLLYGLVFPFVPHKHRLQMLEHFHECIKQAKGARQQAVQINIFSAVLCSLKGLADSKTAFGQQDVRKAAIVLVFGALGSSNPILRCAAGEALGRMAQVTSDSKFIAEIVQSSFDKLKSARDVVTRTGHSLALGCLHRYVGGMGSGHHLNTSVSILLALAQDSTSPVVQVWSLHALGLIADSGGPMFRGYVEPSLSLVLQLLLHVPPSNVDVHQCLGKCLAALITTIGPELQSNQGSIATARLSCLVCCAIMQDNSDALVKAEAISCLQQLHLFAPRHVNLTTLVPHLCRTLSSPHLLLRRAAVACLRQLAQREAREVCDHALATLTRQESCTQISYNVIQRAGPKKQNRFPVISETGLEGALFSLLDTEVDSRLICDTKETLVSLLQSLASDNLTRWLSLIKSVLQTPSESSVDVTSEVESREDEGGALHQGSDKDQSSSSPHWPTRVFAIECLLKVMSACRSDERHLDLALAKQLSAQQKGDFLVLHLSELVRMAFIAATSDSDKLRLAGLAALQDIISIFCKIPEPEFPGHVILEQYQAQVGAALRPAFAPDTAPDVTAMACEVCSAWIGSGVARDLNDLRRVHQLLVSSLSKLKAGKESPLFSESASTMEKLAVLRAWAEVYVMAVMHDEQAVVPESHGEVSSGESLLNLVEPEMSSLSRHWLAALKDHALLSLPSEYASQLPAEGGSFYSADTMDSSRPYYHKAWPPIMHAVCLWLRKKGFTNIDHDSSRPANMQADDSDTDRFHLLSGICIEALCSPTSVQPIETIMICLRSLSTTLDDVWPRSKLGADPSLAVEILNVLHRLLLTRDSVECFLLIMDVVTHVLKAMMDALESERESGREVVGEGGETGEIEPGKSVVFATLEVCLCVLVRRLPGLNPSIPSTGFQFQRRRPLLVPDVNNLLCSVVRVLPKLIALCSPKGSIAILPTVLYLLTGVIREVAIRAAPSYVEAEIPSVVMATLQALQTICLSPLLREGDFVEQWTVMMRSAMATLIDYALPNLEKEQAGIDEGILVLSLTIFIKSLPKSVVYAKNLLEPSVSAFNSAWTSGKVETHLKCVQALNSIVSGCDAQISAPFIHAVVPAVVDRLLQRQRVTTSAEMQLCIETTVLSETLMSAAERVHQPDLLGVLVPMLVHCLKREKKNAHETKLHDFALQRLMKVGPTYSTEFRRIMQNSPEMRQKLEDAIKVQQEQSKTNKLPGESHSDSSHGPARPSIQLKTHFNHF